MCMDNQALREWAEKYFIIYQGSIWKQIAFAVILAICENTEALKEAKR